MNIAINNNLIRKFSAIFVSLVTIAFFIYYVQKNFSEIPKINWDISTFIVFSFSIALVVFSTAVVGTIWLLLLRDRECFISWKDALIIFSISQFGKYLPGNVGQHVGRVAMAYQAGIALPTTLSTMLIETLWGAGIATGLSLLSYVFFVDDLTLAGKGQFHPLYLSIGAVLLVSSPWVGVALLNRFFSRFLNRWAAYQYITMPRLLTAFYVGFLFLACFIIIGVILKLQAIFLFDVDSGSVLELTCLFSVAWLAGYLLPGAPGGLGVREAMMVILLSPVIGAGPATGLAITLRITTSFGDLFSFFLGFLARRILT